MSGDMHEDSVQPVELGPRVVEALRRFEVGYDGGCGHVDADQWAEATALRSSCIDCLRAAATTAPWERSGACHVCGRLVSDEPVETWAVPSPRTGVVVAVRMCGDCRDEQVLALGEPESKGDEEMAGKAMRLPFMAWKAITAGVMPQTGLDQWSIDNLSCCKACADDWRDTAEGRRKVLALHADCREAIGRIADASHERSRRLGPDGQPRAHRIAAIRGVLAVAKAGDRP